MKILHVIDQFGLEYGGSSEVCYQIAKALARHGHNIYIYAWRIGKPYPMLDNLCLSNKLPSWSSSWKPDIIHMHNYRSFANICSWAYAKINHIPYVLQAHGSVATFFQKRIQKRCFDLVIGHRILRDANKVIAVSKNEANQYIDMDIPESKVVLIPNGIDLWQYSSLHERGIFRKRWHIDEDTKTVLYLGRLHWMKGLDLLIKAFAYLEGKVKLVIVGSDDGYLADCKSLVKNLGLSDKVLFTGALYGEQKREAYVASDVYVFLPSYEIFGITVLEAVACGVPIIATANCGIVDLMPSIYTITKREPAIVASAIDLILADKMLALKLKTQGQELVKGFDWDIVAKRLESSVYQIVEKETK